MAQTKIEWVLNPDGSQGITLNSKTGCQNHTPEGLCLGGLFPCYAWKLAHGRLRTRYLEHGGCFDADRAGEDVTDPFHPRWWPGRLAQIKGVKKPTGIFLDDMSDWMGDYWPEEWTKMELQIMRDCPQHIFYTLTKQPQNLPRWDFPENCFVGVTATNTSMAWIASKQLSQIEARVKFLSLEPLLSWETSTPYTTENIVAGLNGSLGWIILGALTFRGNIAGEYPDLTPMPHGRIDTLQPRIEWVREIVEAADKAGIPVFLKDNIRPLLIPEDSSKPNYLMEDIFWASEKAQLRQEMPAAK